MSDKYQFNETCRLCAHTAEKLTPIFDSTGSFEALILNFFPSLNVKRNDTKPQQICLECANQLRMYDDFKQRCLLADNKFEEFIRQSSSLEKTGHLPEEIPEEGVILLSNLENEEQNYLVMIEVKFKNDLPSLPSTTREQEPTTEKVNETLPVDSYKVQPKLREGKKVFECTKCKKTFARRTRLKRHMACHYNVRPHVCQTCNKKFPMKWDLSLHEKLHSRAHVCSTCDKAFMTKTRLERHFRCHTGERPFPCTTCGKCFSEKRNLDNHLRSHTGERPYACETCGKAFSVRSHLVEHFKVHNQQTPLYECGLCSKKFKWKSNYYKHVKNCH